MNLLQLIGYPLFLVAAFEILLAVILLKENPRNSPVNKSVSAFSFFAAAFAFITALMYVRASLGHDITFLARANWISWMMIPAGLQFILYMRDENSRTARLAGRILYPFWLTVFCISVSTDLIERGHYTLIPFIDRSGPLGKPLRLVGILLILWFIYEIYHLKRHVTGIKRTQLNYFMYGLLIFACGGSVLSGVLQLFGGFGLEPGLGSYFSLPWVVLTFYAITRYRLFDIRTVISRTMTIALLSALFSVIQIGFFNIFEPVIGSSWTIIISLLFIGFVFFGTPFSRSIQKGVQHLVFQHKFDYQQILKESSKAVVSILNLQELLDYLIQSIKTSLGVQNVCLFLKRSDGQYVQPGKGIQQPLCTDRILDRSVAEWVKSSGRVVMREELESRFSGAELRFLNSSMKEKGAELFMPLFYKGNLQGVLTLGKKGNREAYVQSDLDLLEALANQAAVAIENARLYENERQIQQSLRESQERFRNLIETTSDWVWEMDDRGVYTYVSPKMRDILGYESEEVLGKTFFDFMPREEARRVADIFVSLTRQKKPFMVYQNTYLHKSGRIVVIETSGVPIFDEAGNFAGYRGIDRDVTKRNELEGLLRYMQKMEAIGRLAAGVAHDFNNINAVVSGYAGLLQSKMKEDDPLHEYVNQILAASERAANLTQTLLAFSRKNVVDLRPVNLKEIIRNIERPMADLIRSDIELLLNPLNKDLVITGDPLQVERVVMNLVSNARDAMPHGGRLIIETRDVVINDEFINTHGYGKPGTYALISVADTGTGMDERTLKRIFEPFFTTKSAGKGTGFGLSIVYDIVKQHKGYVNVSSALGKGTTFNVYLPLSGAVVLESSAGQSAAGIAKSETILIADNDAKNGLRADRKQQKQ